MFADFPGHVVLVTHDQREAYRLCTHLAVLDNGRCIAQGKTATLFTQPELARVARLTGCRNISPVKRVGTHRVLALDWGVELIASELVTDDVSAVGIRDGSFVPTEEGFSLRCVEQLEEVDGISARMVAQDAGALWVRLPRSAGIPQKFSVAPEDVLLLKGDM